ncbi:heme exporter protein CcmD [Vibrio plantisponsor]|jgi:heme exporter protein D|uniref:Heme exporter protein D n=1 Tax=Vibrio plantisponsor TaxID=664643 RepID=A0ABU4IGL5_9VIBR|nr:heme exporter protein CcmD [Vibrio plantisponsor]MDW6017688.1 heme exporter protein CcmD [Vibrio plantisponsor]NNM40521.1 heme exporter protein CcmD [Vibrio plantisponsor]
MHFETWSDFFAMGGYASYVWGGFGITYLSMAVLWLLSINRSKALMQEVRNKIKRQERIEAAKHMENTL